MQRRHALRERYGRWAVVAGASEGLGAAYAQALARNGFDLVLVARRPGPLEDLALRLRAEHEVEVRTVALDLGDAGAIAELVRATATLEVGVAVYNAALAPLGDLVAMDPEVLDAVVDLNVRGPLRFARTFAPPMVARRRGALVVVSSLAGMQGTPRLTAYAASKAFGRVLAEGLWAELRGRGVDVVGVVAGAIRTPGYDRRNTRDAPGTCDPDFVARKTLHALGRGPSVVPGWINRIAAAVVGRWMPRRMAIAVMAASTRDLA